MEELMLYRTMPGEKKPPRLLLDMVRLIEKSREICKDKEEGRALFYRCAGALAENAREHGFAGNLWQTYLTYFLVNSENAYSIACEKREAEGIGSIRSLALHDLRIVKELFDTDLITVAERFSAEGGEELTNFQNGDENGFVFNRRIRDRINELSRELSETKTAEEFQRSLESFYRQFGVGTFGLHKAFRIGHDEKGEVLAVPIKRIAHVQLSDLVGYENAKQKLLENTEAFVRGRPANNCILYGDAGTGKSSSIKGIINRYYEDGLRMIEVYKHEFQDLNPLISLIKKRNYRFILFMDDLSFEDFEIEYKYLKAVIEGGLERKPENVLIYATSNRRHLVRERFSDRDGQDDIHKNATVQEKLSLVARFGVSIYFGAPEPEEFREIVLALAERAGLTIPREELLLLANQWQLSHGGLSGRTAVQFIDHLLGKETRR